MTILGIMCVAKGHARKSYDREIRNTLFVPKDTWTGGVTFSYLEAEADNYQFMVLDDVNGLGYTFKISPHVAYFFKNDLAVGLRAQYKRTYIDFDNLDLDMGDDLSFNVSDYSYLQHEFNATGFLRSYTSLGQSKIFAFFAEASLTYGYSQGKVLSGKGKDFTGTYQTTNHFQLGCTPGLTAFVTNNMAVEVSVDILGLDFQWINQTTNQVEKGNFRKSSADFSINLFSINLGVYAYF